MELIQDVSKIKIHISLLGLVILSCQLVSATLIEYNEYEINKLSEIIPKDCGPLAMLIICRNFDSIGWGFKENCIDFRPLKRASPFLEFSQRGELQRYYKGYPIAFDAHTKTWEGNDFFLRIENITKEDVKTYLDLRNGGYVGGSLIGDADIGCFLKENSSDYRVLKADKYNQKYWGGKLIKEPRTYIYIGELKVSMFDFGLGFSFAFISWTLIKIGIKFVKKFKLRKRVNIISIKK